MRAYALSFLLAYYGLFFGIMRGFKNKNNYNDNTSGVATILSIIDELSPEELNKVAFILFDNEEKGKKGSKAYFNDHKEQMKDKFLVNFDCVGNGDNVIFIAEKDAIDSTEYKLLESSFNNKDGFSLNFFTHKQADSNSDHKNFPKGVACVVCKKLNSGLLYTPNIHTNGDIVANNSNIEFLTKNTCAFVRNLL
jgi:Zn-dependent M28 family amino/carboxypeptidase